MLYRALREVGAVTGGALNPLLPQQAKSDPQLHHSFPVHHHTPRWVACRNNHAHARSCEKADLASLKLSCDVEQLYTDATLVLDASTSIYACSSGRRKRRSELALAMRRRAGPRAYASKWEAIDLGQCHRSGSPSGAPQVQRSSETQLRVVQQP